MTDILIVDGNAGFAAMLATTLQLEGFTAASALTCHGALAIISESDTLPRTLVVDLEALLPADAADVERIQQLTERIPCIVLTTDWHHTHPPLFQISGSICKPFHLDAFLAQIQVALHQAALAA